MQIQLFTPDDVSYQQLCKVHNAAWPENKNTPEQWKYADAARKPELFFERYVAYVDGQMVAWGTVTQHAWSFQEGKYGFYGAVHPEYRRRGIGSRLYEQLCAAVMAEGASKLVAETREDQPDGLRFLEKRGFQRAMRYPISELAVAAFDFARFQATVDAVLASGIVIKPLSALQTEEPEWKQKSYDLEWELLKDVPSPDPLTPTGVEQYEKEILGNPDFMPEAYYVALDGTEYVGMSNLWRDPANLKRLNTGLTGVKRSHRRRGIATALKVHGIRFAQAYGAEIIETGNEENNPMYQLNLQLGYQPKPAWMDFIRELNGQQ
jgi:ribosomal protein S18 acetylase RimI-like enzyme/predicted GNAT family acetyltransferase